MTMASTQLSILKIYSKNRIALIGDSYIEAQHINKGKNVVKY